MQWITIESKLMVPSVVSWSYIPHHSELYIIEDVFEQIILKYRGKKTVGSPTPAIY